MKRAMLIVGLLTVFAVALAGCGGSSHLSSSAFKSKVAAICTGAKAKSQRVEKLLNSGAPSGLEAVQSELKGVATKLQGLSGPLLLDAARDAFVAGLNKSVALFGSLQSALKSGNKSEANSIEHRIKALNSGLDAAAAKLAPACAGGS